jgi:hypothetical protein
MKDFTSPMIGLILPRERIMSALNALAIVKNATPCMMRPRILLQFMMAKVNALNVLLLVDINTELFSLPSSAHKNAQRENISLQRLQMRDSSARPVTQIALLVLTWMVRVINARNVLILDKLCLPVVLRTPIPSHLALYVLTFQQIIKQGDTFKSMVRIGVNPVMNLALPVTDLIRMTVLSA